MYNQPMKNMIAVVSLLIAVGGTAAASPEGEFLSSANAGHTVLRQAFQQRRLVSASSQQEEDTLLDLLRDNDPGVRLSAVKGLKAYVSRRSSTRDRVLDVLRDSHEEILVRAQAAKTLSIVSGYSEVYERLLDIARGNEDAGLRAVAYKSLYWQVASRSDVRDAVMDSAKRERDTEVRKGAIWAMFAGSGNSSTREALLDMGKRDSDPEIRVEALKSLYSQMGYSDVREAAYDLARNRSSEPSVRVTAILMHAFRTNNNQRELLQDISQRDSDMAARRAAITALGDPNSEEIYRYFHLVRRDSRGILIGDPLDYE